MPGHLLNWPNGSDRVLAVGHIFQYRSGRAPYPPGDRIGALWAESFISHRPVSTSGPPKSTVDVVWDLATHDLSIILHLIGEMPDRVTASGSSYQWDGLIDNAHIDLGFPGGATAHVHVGWLSAGKTRLTQVFAENGSIVYDEMLALDGKVKLYGRGMDNRVNAKDSDAASLGYSAGEIHVLNLEQHEPLRMECAEFVRAISTGTPLVNDGYMGAKVVEVLEWASRQIAQSSEVTIARGDVLAEAATARSGSISCSSIQSAFDAAMRFSCRRTFSFGKNRLLAWQVTTRNPRVRQKP